jgi:hypothetical protein
MVPRAVDLLAMTHKLDFLFFCDKATLSLLLKNPRRLPVYKTIIILLGFFRFPPFVLMTGKKAAAIKKATGLVASDIGLHSMLRLY